MSRKISFKNTVCVQFVVCPFGHVLIKYMYLIFVQGDSSTKIVCNFKNNFLAKTKEKLVRNSGILQRYLSEKSDFIHFTASL